MEYRSNTTFGQWVNTSTVRSAYKVCLHRVFEICKTRFIYRGAFKNAIMISHYTQYARHKHSIYNAIFNINRVTQTQSMWKDRCYNLE